MHKLVIWSELQPCHHNIPSFCVRDFLPWRMKSTEEQKISVSTLWDEFLRCNMLPFFDSYLPSLEYMHPYRDLECPNLAAVLHADPNHGLRSCNITITFSCILGCLLAFCAATKQCIYTCMLLLAWTWSPLHEWLILVLYPATYRFVLQFSIQNVLLFYMRISHLFNQTWS